MRFRKLNAPTIRIKRGLVGRIGLCSGLIGEQGVRAMLYFQSEIYQVSWS